MNDFKSKQVVRETQISLKSAIEKVFPLFTPIEEKKWDNNWNPKLLHSETTEIKKGTIFQSSENNKIKYWVIADLDIEKHYIRYINFLANDRLTILEISCSSKIDNITKANIKYVFTGLSQSGNDYVEEFNEEEYEKYICEWEMAINEYLHKQK